MRRMRLQRPLAAHHRSISRKPSATPARASSRCASAAAAPRISTAASLHGEVLDTRAYRGHRRLRADRARDHGALPARRSPRSKTPCAERGQMLAFEPPHFGDGATLGGCVAAGLSGPRRPYAGSVRDFVLGVRMLDGKGTDLRFGGQVMKNVAGYDVSRLMVGSLGTLGVLLEISLKVLPLPPRRDHAAPRARSQADAIALMNAWAGKPLPDHGDLPRRRASSTCGCRAPSPAVRAARAKLGGEEIAEDGAILAARARSRARLLSQGRSRCGACRSSPPPAARLRGAQLIEWSGALRWLAGDADPAHLRDAAARAAAMRRSSAAATSAPASSIRSPPLTCIATEDCRSARHLKPGRSYPISERRSAQLPAACIHELSSDANQSRRFHQGHARRPRSRRDPAQVRALRLLHRDVPDLSAPRRRARRAARAHLSHQAGARRRARHREDAAPSRPLPHVPRVRDDVSFRRALQPPARHRPRRSWTSASSAAPAEHARAQRYCAR